MATFLEKLMQRCVVNRERIVLVLGILLASFGVIFVLAATPHGIGVSSDAAQYICCARSLLSGNGLTVLTRTGQLEPLTVWPPLYPSILALLSYVLAADPWPVARWLNAFLFGGNILLFGCCVYHLTRSCRTTALGSVLFLFSPVLLSIHTMAWSEPLFLLLGVLSVLLMSCYIRNGSVMCFAGSCLAGSMSCLTRYAGICFLSADIIALLFACKLPFWGRLRTVLLFLVCSSLPLVWFLWGIHSSSTSIDEQITFASFGFGKIRQCSFTLLYWFLPASIPSKERIAVFLIIALIFLTCMKAGLRFFDFGKHLIFIVFIPLYFIVVVIAITFKNHHIPLDNRILSPMYVFVIIVSLCYVSNYLRVFGKVGSTGSIRRPLVLILSGCLVASYLCRGTVLLTSDFRDGRGYASEQMTGSRIVRYIVSSWSSTMPIYSNAPDALYFLTGRRTRYVPFKVYPRKGRLNTEYLNELRAMEQSITEENAIVVLFSKELVGRKYLPSLTELEQVLPLRPMFIETSREGRWLVGCWAGKSNASTFSREEPLIGREQR